MANDLMHFQDLLPATQSGDRRLSRAAAQQANEMEQIAAVARIAMNESSSTTVYATCKGLSTVTLAYLLRQEALERGITLEDEGAFRQLTQEYMNALNYITRSANMRIARAAEQWQPGRSEGTPLEEFAYWLANH